MVKGKDKKKNYWLELQIVINQELEDAVCDFLITELNRGVIVEELPKEGIETKLLIKAYLSREDLETGALGAIETYLDELKRLHSGYLDIKIDLNHIVEEDWQDSWKRYFKPIKVGKRLVIKPTWETYIPNSDEIVIEIDPGRAFGVGTHPSTRLVLQRLEELYENGELANKEVLDIGTGSGILAISAAKFNASSILGVDIDKDAVETARENVHLNHVHKKVAITGTPIWELEGPYDIVLANLDRDTLTLLAEEIARLVKKTGILITSGILKEQLEAVKRAFSNYGLEPTLTKRDENEDEWVLIEFRKKN